MRLAAAVLLLCLSGCSTTVIPPRHPVDPVTVYLTDYGRHSSLVIPTAPGRYNEYAFGDWDFFARGKTRWWIAVRAMLRSPQATLGRRHVNIAADEPDAVVRERLGCARLMKFNASRHAVAVLSMNLERPFRVATTLPVTSDYSMLEHVIDDEHYWGCHNCNHVTARWLRQLDCQIQGLAIFSSFHVRGAVTDVATTMQVGRLNP
jgi:hypothetical protein